MIPLDIVAHIRHKQMLCDSRIEQAPASEGLLERVQVPLYLEPKVELAYQKLSQLLDVDVAAPIPVNPTPELLPLTKCQLHLPEYHEVTPAAHRVHSNGFLVIGNFLAHFDNLNHHGAN